MKQLEIVIQNQTGLHARPAKVLVNLAKQFKSDVSIQYGAKRINAKSMVSVLTLGAVCGSQVTIQTNGEDEDQALASIEQAIKDKLGDVDHAEAEPALLESAIPAPVPVVALPATPAVASAPGVIQAVAAAPGIAIGPVFHFHKEDLQIDEAVDKDPEGLTKLEKAMAQAREQLIALFHQMTSNNMAAEAAIFEAHLALLDDPDITDAVKTRVAGGKGAARSWLEAVEERAAMIADLKDSLLSARADDLRDVGRRVLRILLGVDDKAATFPDFPVVVFASELSPSETASFNAGQVLGFCIVNGGPTSHIAILAKALGIPALVGANDSILTLAENLPVILNGNDGTLTLDPTPETRAEAEKKQRAWLEHRQAARQAADQPAITLDGRRVDVTANAGSAEDAVKAVKMGADGICLLRTEFLFLERNTGPTEDEQFQVYQAIASTMNPRPVIVRTLDIGGDKPLAYIQLKPELNPFLGERGIRLCLNRPELFREQLRAILRASTHGKLRIMFPMVMDVSELRQARVIVNELCAEMNLPGASLGIMIEVPSAALLADKFAPEIDFFSIGTNDLTQYTLAVDRGNASLATKHDGLHPAVLKLIALTVEGAHKYGKRADICGELGSDPLAIPVLLGLGLDELSVSIPSVPIVKAQVRTLKMSDLQPLAREALTCESPQEVRALVKKQVELWNQTR
ncbi:MAG TPA: phosphoenolpyruvate--protein phosphotransferase [Anaerolineales bacterium]